MESGAKWRKEWRRLDFLGTYNYNMDPKKRVFIPAKYREALKDGFVVCKAPDPCLYIYSKEEWEPVADQVKSLPGSAEYRRFKRDFFKNADMVELDSQGRFTIKAELAAYANLQKSVVIAGAGNKFEIWDAEAYENDCEQALTADQLNVEVIF